VALKPDPILFSQLFSDSKQSFKGCDLFLTLSNVETKISSGNRSRSVGSAFLSLSGDSENPSLDAFLQQATFAARPSVVVIGMTGPQMLRYDADGAAFKNCSPKGYLSQRRPLEKNFPLSRGAS